jgi:hypothetical protein
MCTPAGYSLRSLVTSLVPRRAGRRPGRAPKLRRLAVRALPLTTLLFAIPVLTGVAQSLAGLLGTTDPYLEYDSRATQVDGQAVFVGTSLYADPADGYGGLPLTPLFPLALGLLDHLHDWAGWGPLLSIASGLALAAMAARLAYGPLRGGEPEAPIVAVGAIGLGALSWWFVQMVPFHFLYSARADQAAWALALGGLLLVPSAAAGSRRALVAAIVLLSAAFWTKQPAGIVAVACTVWLTTRALQGRARGADAVALVGGLLALNGIVFGLLALVTGGWSSFFLVELPVRVGTDQALLDSVGELLSSVAPVALFAGVLWLLAAAGRSSKASGYAGRGDPAASVHARDDGARAGLLLTFVALGSLAAVLGNLKVGSAQNQFVGVVWALAFLGALAWRRGLAHPRGAAAGAVVVAALFVVSQFEPLRSPLRDLDVYATPARFVHTWYEAPAALRDAAEERRIYHPVFGDLNVRARDEVYPTHVHLQDLLAAGEQPRWLVGLFLARRFGAVYVFDNRPRFREYASGAGRHEDNYFWKLNQVLRARYRLDRDAPPSLRGERLGRLPGDYRAPGPFVRRLGPERARWMRACFGPFDIDGARFEIGDGGGFWCRQPSRAVLRMRGTPAPISEIRSSGRAVTGRLVAALPHEHGRLSVQCGDHAPAMLARSGPTVIHLPAGGCAPLTLRASRGSDARFDLGGLRAE